MELLDIDSKIEPRPLINLKANEIEKAQKLWAQKKSEKKRLVIAPGAGFEEKSWGNNNFTKLTALLEKIIHFRYLLLDHLRIKKE